jgi:hypothetical protein
VWARSVAQLVHGWANRSIPGYHLQVDTKKILDAISLQTNTSADESATILQTTPWREAPTGADKQNKQTLKTLDRWMESNALLTPRYWYRLGLRAPEENSTDNMDVNKDNQSEELKGGFLLQTRASYSTSNRTKTSKSKIEGIGAQTER